MVAAVAVLYGVSVIMIISCSIVISTVVVVVMLVEWLIPLLAYCDAEICSCLVTVAVLLFSSAEPTGY